MLNNSKLNRITETPNNKSAENVLNPWREDFMARENASNILIADRSSTCNISGLLQHGNIASAYNDRILDKSNPINTAMIASTQRSRIENDTHSAYMSCSHKKQPLTARCGSLQPQFAHDGLGSGFYNSQFNLTTAIVP